MSVHRLFIPGPIAAGASLRIEGDQAHYLTRVLRLRTGSDVIIFDGSGPEYPAVITEIQKQFATLQTGDARLRDVESPLDVRLVQGISRGERMDFVVQKAVELGVHRISPVLTEFSVVRLNEDRANRRAAHWNKVAQSACEQCGRNRVPVVDEPLALQDFLQQDAAADCRLLLHPGASKSLERIARPARGVELLIGPEGGLSAAEREAAVAAGFTGVSLGPRVLRTETAALAALAIMQALWGDLQA